MLKILAIILAMYVVVARADNSCRDGFEARRACGNTAYYCVSPESLFCVDSQGICAIVNQKDVTKCSDANYQELDSSSNPYSSGDLTVEPL